MFVIKITNYILRITIIYQTGRYISHFTAGILGTKYMKFLIKHTLLISLLVLGNAAFAEEVSGKVNFFNDADRHFDNYSANPNTQQQQWMRSHYDRMLTYAPYFNSRLDWYPNALVYRDSYAVYKNENIVANHPEWIMRDAGGNKLYIPYACKNGTCPQYAGDFSNPAFRKYRVKQFINISRGYRGLWIDDVNLTWRVSNGYKKHAKPIDFTTGQPMTLTAWRRHMAKYMEEIRAALPNIEISHNVVWYSDRVENDNPYIKRQIDAADYITLERGGNDKGLKNGLGKYGFESFLLYVDFIHSRGANAIIMDNGTTVENREFGLATWLLVNNGKDLFNSDRLKWTTPDRWWSGYDLNLGKAMGPRYKWHELIRRDFECGMVILNQPHAETQNVEVGNLYTNLVGESVSTVQFDAREAAILLKECGTISEDDVSGTSSIPQVSTVSFQNGVNGYTGTEDTMLDDSSPDRNFHSATILELDGAPKNTSALMRWNVSKIPTNATVESVEIFLYVSNRSEHSYEIYEVKKPWIENQATWNQYTARDLWNKGGAKSSKDRVKRILGRLKGSSSRSRYLTVSLDAYGIALVQSWVKNPASNNGFVFIDYFASDGLDLYSSENSNISKRPKITIKYSEN